MKLVWENVGGRYYEAGVDRGVLYVDAAGVVWNGLISVDDRPSGGAAKAYYLDGVKYLNLSEAEEFVGTIQAFYSPPEFDPCDGSLALSAGLYATNQPRKSFGLAYRSLIGNDIDGTDHAYKIHLIYNALAAPTQRSYATLGKSVSPSALSWEITTLPPSVSGAAPTAHLFVDSSELSPGSLTALENVLYGSDTADPRLPAPDEVYDIVVSHSPLTVTDNGDGTATISGSDQIVKMVDSNDAKINSVSITTVDANTFTISSQ